MHSPPDLIYWLLMAVAASPYVLGSLVVGVVVHWVVKRARSRR